MLFPFRLIHFLNQYKIHLTDSPETPPPDSVKITSSPKKTMILVAPDLGM